MRTPASRSTLLASVASIGWLGAAGYAASSLSGSLAAAWGEMVAGGFGSLASGVAGVSLPLLLIWNWADRRRAKVDSESGRASSARARGAVTNKDLDAMEAQINRLASQYSALEQHFAQQSDRLTELASGLTGQVDDITRALDDQAHRLHAGEDRVRSLTGTLGDITQQANSTAQQISDRLEKPMVIASGRMETVAGHIRTHVEDLWTQLQNLESAYGATREMAEGARSALHKQVGDIHHVSALAGKELAALTDSLRPQIDLIEGLGRRAAERSADMQKHIDAQALALEKMGEVLKAQGESLTRAVKAQAHQLDSLKDTVESLGGTLADQFRMQVDGLLETSERAGEQVMLQVEKGTRSLEERLGEHGEKLELITRQVNDTIEEVCGKVDAQLARMRSGVEGLDSDLAKATERATTALNRELITLVDAIESRVSLIEDKAAEINGTIATSGRDLDSQLTLTRERIAEATRDSFDDMKVQTGALVETMRSALAERSSAVGETINLHIEALTQASREVEAVLREQQKGFADDLEQRLASTSARFASRLSEMQEATRKVDSDLAAQTDSAVTAIASKVDQVTREIAARLAGVTEGAESLQTQLDTSLRLIEARQEEVVEQMSTRATAASAALGKSLEQQLSALGENAATLQSRVDGALDLVNARIDQLVARLGKDNGALLAQLEEGAAELLGRFGARLRQAREQGEDELRSLDGKLESSATAFNALLDQQGATAEARFDSLFARLASQVGEATDSAYQRLTGLVASYQSDIAEVADGALVQLVTVGRELPEIAEQLGAAIDLALAKAGGIEGAYAARTEELTRLSGELLGFSDRLRGEIAALPAQTEQTLERIAEQSENTRGLLTRQHSEIEAAMGSSEAQVEAYRLALDSKLQQFNRLFEDLQRYSHNIEAVVDEQVRSITSSTDHAKRAWLDARSAMEEQTAAANEIADGYIDRMAELSKRARAEVGDLRAMSEEAVHSVRQSSDVVAEQLQSFGSTLTGLRALIDQVGGAAERHNEAVSATAEEAERRTHRLVEQLNESQKSRFLKSASEMVAQLNQLAVDVDAILDGELSSEVVRAYRDGDRGISVRRLLSKRREPQTDLRIVDAYRNNPGFSAKVDSYLGMFEQLLSQAKTSDPTRMVHTAFLTGDLGKLYVFLSSALGLSLSGQESREQPRQPASRAA